MHQISAIPTVTPAKPGNAVAWSSFDRNDDVVHMWTDAGHWFSFDFKTGKSFTSPSRVNPRDLASLAHNEADRDGTIAQCYFIGGEEGPVKIGFSIDVRSRIRAIQLCSPVRLRVLAIARGGASRESAYHIQFDRFRMHGEWFERSPEIIAEIARLNRARS